MNNGKTVQNKRLTEEKPVIVNSVAPLGKNHGH
jgi:hypothetical protein